MVADGAAADSAEIWTRVTSIASNASEVMTPDTDTFGTVTGFA